MFNIVILGPPGCGKGTQSKFIIEKYGMVHLSTGDIFRREIDAKHPFGEVIRKIINTGNLVPEAIVLQEIQIHVAKYPEAEGLLFDGFPRTVFQAEFLDWLMLRKGAKVDLAIYLDVPNEILLERIKRRGELENREDDRGDVAKQRLIVYNEQTAPVIAHYQRKGILESIRGDRDINDVQTQLAQIIERYQNK